MMSLIGGSPSSLLLSGSPFHPTNVVSKGKPSKRRCNGPSVVAVASGLWVSTRDRGVAGASQRERNFRHGGKAWPLRWQSHDPGNSKIGDEGWGRVELMWLVG